MLSGHVPSQRHRFQSERESGDRNFAIGYYLKEKKVNAGPTSSHSLLIFPFALHQRFTVTLLLLYSLQCFPEGTDMTSILDFYFQVHISRCCTCTLCLQLLSKLYKLILY